MRYETIVLITAGLVGLWLFAHVAHFKETGSGCVPDWLQWSIAIAIFLFIIAISITPRIHGPGLYDEEAANEYFDGPYP